MISLRDGIGFDDIVAFCAGMMTICGFLWWLLRPVVRQAHRFERFWEDWQGTDAAPGRGRTPGVMERLQSIDGELTRNGGNSLKDRVVETSRKLDELAQQNACEHTDLAGQIQNVKDEANRWHEARHKGDTQ
jgi:hypothetical protein